jgi:hypothetical protein
LIDSPVLLSRVFGPPIPETSMRNVGRKLAFVLAASNHGTMILNRFDSRVIGPDLGYGVSHQILEAGAFDPLEIETALQLLDLRKRCYGDGVVAIDCGAPTSGPTPSNGRRQ